MTDTQRNFLILGCLAVIGVLFSGPFGAGVGVLSTLLNIAFLVVIVAGLVMLYRSKSGTIAQMDATPRLVLQLCGAVLLVTLVTGSLTFIPVAPLGWASYGGTYTMMFWAIIFACGFGIWWAWQQRRSSW